MGAPAEIQELVERFARNRDTYRQGTYKEAELRQEFIDPFFEALGWDMANKQGYAEAYKDVVHEASLKIGSETKAPDYCMRVGGTRKFYVEAKKPAINIKNDVEPVFQLKRYAWSAKLPLSILTNFAAFAVYDCARQPAQLEHPATGRILYVTFEEYDSRWAEIRDLFSRDAVLKGLFDTFALSTKAKRGTAEVDAAFLTELDLWRTALASNLNLRNPGLQEAELNWAVQQTVDRIVFLRICEDRGIEVYGRLRNAAGQRGTYESLAAIFRDADDRFNSGLFHFTEERGRGEPDRITLNVHVDDAVLKRIVGRLYYPDSPYEFSVLPPDILGQVYEQFLGKTITLERGRARIEVRPEVAKAGGVYYTPTHIVAYINQQTLAPLLQTADLEGMRGVSGHPVRVLDPACGSGSFLLSAYQILLDWYLDRYLDVGAKWAKGPSATIREDGRGGWRLTTSERKRILLRHIFGVDIDQQAVEVTKLSLLLKVLEGETQEGLQQQLALFHDRALPDLDENIKCGNSLVAPAFLSEASSAGLTQEERRQVNVFGWEAEFPEAMVDGGFEAVVGNPPWLMAGYYVKPSLRYFREHFRAARGKYDLYYLFLEQALKLAAASGRIGMIVPNKLFHTQAARRLRESLLTDRRLETVVDFDDAQVFARATNYSCILLFGPGPSSSVKYYRATARLSTIDSFEVPISTLGSGPWHFTGATETRLFAQMRAAGTPLKDLTAHFGNGVQTGADQILLVDGPTAAAAGFEPEALSPFLRGRDVKRYSVTRDRTAAIFPYRSLGGRYVVVDEAQLDRWPKVRDYLKSHRAALQERVWFGKTATELSGAWYGLMYVDRPDAFTTLHLVTPSLSKQTNFALDEGALFATGTAGVTSVVPKPGIPETTHFLLAVLNSTLITYYAVGHSPVFQGGFHKFSRRYLENLPIPRIKPGNPLDVRKRDSLEALARERLRLADALRAAATPHQKRAISREIADHEMAIDALVAELYGLSAADVQFVVSAEKARLLPRRRTSSPVLPS